MASAVNHAYDTLRSPLLRAAYLLKLQGLDSSGENTTVSDMNFLMSQMQLREQLGAVTTANEPFVALDLVATKVAQELSNLQAQFGEQYGQALLLVRLARKTVGMKLTLQFQIVFTQDRAIDIKGWRHLHDLKIVVT